jgi:CRISPR-associated endonuclease/helicase Cas3
MGTVSEDVRELMAHTPNEIGVWHPLVEHLTTVASMARQFGEPLGLGEVAYWTGLWHDVGKASCTFQEYLRACACGDPAVRTRFAHRDHKRAGVSLAKTSGRIEAAFAIDGHHGGIPALAQLRERLPGPDEFDDVIATVGALLHPSSLHPANPLSLPRLPRRDEELRVRFLASCLVDADFLDTERHFTKARSNKREAIAFSELQAPFNKAIADLRARSEATAVNKARVLYFDHVVSRARSCAPGLYRMTGATGVGKTLAGLGAALAHAKQHNQRRVVVALPYMTVTEQTADVYRNALGGPNTVLEHHSGVSEQSDTLWRRLAAENWDAPVVVTTVVQLFESLFSRTPARLRKLHRLASSVIVLDEAQTIPAGVLEPVAEALNWLVRYAGCTVVLMTATQPAFDLVGPLQEVDMPDWGDFDVGSAFNRVHWRVDKDPIGAETLAAQLAEEESCLCIANTVDDATRVSEALERLDPTHLYLSTRLCREHRRAVMKEVNARLASGRPCRLVSTQLVEAGVDLDFPRVVRISGPLPSLAQAAGRCNRNGLRDFGEVRVVKLVDGRLPPGEYRVGAQETAAVMEAFGAEFHPERPDVLRKWFELVYDAVTLDAHGVNVARTSLDFPLVAERFQLVDRRLTVIVPWGTSQQRGKVEEVTDRLARRTRLARSDWRFLSGFTVELLPAAFLGANRAGSLQALEEGLGRWLAPYHEKLGVVLERQSEEVFQW